MKSWIVFYSSKRDFPGSPGSPSARVKSNAKIIQIKSSFDHDLTIEKSDLTGKIISKKTFTTRADFTYELLLSDLRLAGGIYLLKVTQADHFIVLKIVKE